MPFEPTSSKQSLRRHFRSLRRLYVSGLSPAQRLSAERDLAAITAPLLPLTAVIASYAATGAEIDPRLVETGRTTAFPRVVGEMLVFHLSTYATLLPGFSGIPEPAPESPGGIPTIVLVPLLAATPAGLRLGQGGGYYDRTLAALRARGPIIAIGLAHPVQVVDELPGDPWDEHLDYLATPGHLVNCAHNR